jgi:hypothetical protein
MAKLTTTFQNRDQIDAALVSARQALDGEHALTLMQTAFDHVVEFEPTSYGIPTNSRVSVRYANGDTALIQGSSLLGKTRQISQLDYQFADGSKAVLNGAVTLAANGTLSGSLTQAQIYAPWHGTTTLYGTIDVASHDINLSRVVLQTLDATLDMQGRIKGYIWSDGAAYHTSHSGILNSLNLDQNGQSLQITGLSQVVNSTSGPLSGNGLILADLMKGNDTLTLSGLAGKLFGFDGDDTLNGTDGTDTAQFSGARSHYSVTKNGADWIVKDNAAQGGSDRLVNVERLEFTDGKLALDLAAGGKALSTAKILGAVFGREAVANKEYAGIGLELLDGGTSYAELMELALDARLGAGFSDAELVKLLYQNIAGIQPSTDDLNFYVRAITSGEFTQTSLATMAADLDLNLANIDLVGLNQTGLAYQ